MQPLSVPVLVVDDQTTSLMVLAQVLRRLGFQQVDTASDGFEAISMLHTRRYGLVISDLHMNAVSGLDLLLELRSAAHSPSTPFIMISADDGPEVLAAAEQAGVDAFLPKPFDVLVLQTKLRQVVQRSPDPALMH